MFAHTNEQFQDVSALILSSVINRQYLANSRNYTSGYKLIPISSSNIHMGGLLSILSQTKLKGRDEGTNR
jgi:hypothetical protein